jgi:hypothetical protein
MTGDQSGDNFPHGSSGLMIHAGRGWPAIEMDLFGVCLEALEHRMLNPASCRIPALLSATAPRHLAHPSCIMHMVL